MPKAVYEEDTDLDAKPPRILFLLQLNGRNERQVSLRLNFASVVLDTVDVLGEKASQGAVLSISLLLHSCRPAPTLYAYRFV